MAQCSFTLRLADAAGEGWNGSAVVIGVIPPGGSLQTETATLEAGFLADRVFMADVGATVTLTYHAMGQPWSGRSITLLAMNGWAVQSWAASLSDGLFHAYQVSITCNIPPAPPSDCLGAIHLVNTVMDITVEPESGGFFDDLDASNQGCLGQEQAGFWLRYDAMASSEFGFRAELQNGSFGGDVDFALWGPFPGTMDCATLGEPIRCSVASTGLPTGLCSSAQDVQEDTNGDGWLLPVSVSIGSTYVLYVAVTSDQTELVRVQVTEMPGFDCLALGIAAFTQEPITISPQPAEGELRIEGLSGTSPAMIMAADGRLVSSLGAPVNKVDVSHLPTGTYVLVAEGRHARFVVAR